MTARFSQVETIRTGEVAFDMVGEVQAVLDDHDQDDIDAFILTYRMFVQKNDPISVRSLTKVYSASWMPSEAAGSYSEARLAINQWLDSITGLLDGSHPVTRRELVDVILYGGLAHTDSTKVPTFDAWMRTGSAGFFWAEFMVTLKEMLRLLRFVRDLNEAVLANCAA